MMKNIPARHFKTKEYSSGSKNLIANYYSILGVDMFASAKEIKHQFYKLAQLYHPDKTNSEALDNRYETHENFLLISEAYDVLSNEDLRGKYDLSLQKQLGASQSIVFDHPFAVSRAHAGYRYTHGDEIIQDSEDPEDYST